MVEVAIPIGDITQMSEEGKDFHFTYNVVRARRAGGKEELSTYVPLAGSFHQPDKFKTLKMDYATLKDYLWSIYEPTNQKVSKDKDKLRFEAQVSVTNRTSDYQFFTVESRLISSSGKTSQDSTIGNLDKNQRGEYRIQIPIAETGNAILQIRIRQKEPPYRTLALRTYRVSLEFNPISIKMIAPCYRNNIYATEDLKEIRFIVNSSLPQEKLRGLELLTKLQSYSKDKLYDSQRVLTLNLPQKIKLNARGLKPGKYLLTVMLCDKGKSGFEMKKEVVLRKLPFHKGEVRFNRNNVCLIDGKPFFPLGWFSPQEKDMPKLQKKGYNTCLIYGFGEWRKGYMDTAQKYGLKVILYPYSSGRTYRRLCAKNPARLSEGELLEIKNLVSRWKNHPALLGWYMADEPSKAPAEKFIEVYNLIREEDPYHPCIMLNNHTSMIHKYEGAADVLMPDAYPSFIEGGYASRGIGIIGVFMDTVKKATAGKKPAWIVPRRTNRLLEPICELQTLQKYVTSYIRQ